MTPSVTKVLEECKAINKEHHYFTVLCEKEALKKSAKGKLSGLFVTIKDNICVKGVESTATSRMLKGYKPLFDATIVAKLKKEGAVVLGKTSCDAFGFGSFNVNVGLDYKIPTNPFDTNRSTGGSSGGAAGITQKASFSHVAIAESTGGSIECPAAYCGVIGFVPSYGRISRNGLISYANSLDKIGLMSKKVDELKQVLEVVSGFDPADGTSLKEELDLTSKKKFKIGLIKEGLGKGVDTGIIQSMKEVVEKLRKKGVVVEEVSLPLTFTYGVAAYYIIAMCEASTNLSCLSGLRYGSELPKKQKSFTNYFTEVRSKHFNQESKRRIMLGTFARMAGYRDAYYIKATKARTKIINEYKKLFQKYDVLLSPTMPTVAPTFKEIDKMTPLQNYMMDQLTVGPNLAGVPHASIPIGEKEGMPVGLMAITDHFKEGTLLSFLKQVEDLQ